MFAGLPGIGVGTLFYVLTALWMPFRELAFLARGESSWRRWRLIGTQFVFAISIIASIAVADRLVLRWWTDDAVGSVGPARWVHEQMGGYAPQSVLAAPIAASFLLLGLVLVLVELTRLWVRNRPVRRPLHDPPMARRDAPSIT